MSLPIRSLTKSRSPPYPMDSKYPSEKVAMPQQQVAQQGQFQQELPSRQGTQTSYGTNQSDLAIPSNDTRETSALLEERLRAWKHAVGYLENYIEATEKVHKAHAKEYEKVLKTISDPLKEGSHFDQTIGGVAGLFENMRANTESITNSHLETERNLRGSVLPILERLHKEIKAKAKEINSGVGKAAKEIEKARNTTQKHIELLGQQASASEASNHKVHPHEDPYITQRGVYYRLHKQILEENNNRQDLISVQENFAQFEHHIVEIIQSAMAGFVQLVGGQAQRTQNVYTDMLSTAQRMPPDFEWKGFVERNGDCLVDPRGTPRSVESVQFPNQNHKSTQPLVEGTLERKSRNMLKRSYDTGYYAVTSALYLHGFKEADNFRHDPEPEISIYLPDAIIGVASDCKFQVKGKDVSKGFSSKLSGTSELQFKAHTPQDAEKWVEIMKMAAGTPVGPSLLGPAVGAASAGGAGYNSNPVSPVTPGGMSSRQSSYGSGVPAAHGAIASAPVLQQQVGAGAATQDSGVVPRPHPEGIQTQGITGGQTMASPVAASPRVASPQVVSPVAGKNVGFAEDKA